LIKLPEYMGPLAFGVKMGLIVPGMDIVQTIFDPASSIATGDGLLGKWGYHLYHRVGGRPCSEQLCHHG